MANKKDDNKQTSVKLGPFKKIANLIQGNMDDMYKSTYYAAPENKQNLQKIKDDINNSIKDIMNSTNNSIGEPNISKLYERLFATSNDPNTLKEFESIFGDNELINNLTSSYLDNMWIRAMDQEIDETIRFMPKLQEALDVLRDCVLSADSFSKDFLNMITDLDTEQNKEQFSANIEDLKRNYKLLKELPDIYDNISKYGEEFVYCVPYQKAIQMLMNSKQGNPNIKIKSNFSESKLIMESGGEVVFETLNNIPKELKKSEDIDINVELNNGLIYSVVEEAKNIRDKLSEVKKQSLCEQYFNEALNMNSPISNITFNDTINKSDLEGQSLPTHNNFDETLPDDLQLPNLNDTAADGLINAQKQNFGRIKEMSGCIVKRLPRSRVSPILIDDICLGYYYFEFDENMEFIEDRMPATGMVNTITGIRSNGKSEAFDAAERREEMLRNISAKLSDKIDSNFINANQDLKKEIYYILKYNDQLGNNLNKQNIRVSYIPPEDMHHLYFNLDKKTGRGLSDLTLSLLPAKLYVAIYITNCLGVMTRGNDKRVYYVKQSVETNIAKTMLKTINEIKKANFGVRQIENINSVLNITGRFNDYIIPRGSDGSSPIEFEVMPGQQIEIKTDLLNLLEESAISRIVPIDLIQMRQSVDFATQLTMSSAKFLRYTFSRQSDFQDIINPLLTKMYNVEYGTNIGLQLLLPPPLFINVTNTNQLISNTSEYCNTIVEMMCQNEDDQFKSKFGKNLKIFQLGSYLNMNTINAIFNKSKQEIAIEKLLSNEESDY